MRFYQTGHLTNTVSAALVDNDIPAIKNLFLSNSYNKLTKKEKEKQIFYTIYMESLTERNVDEFLKYIIFDYKISEENSILNITDLTNHVKNMFDSRKLNAELSLELDKKQSLQGKAIKL